MDFPSARGVQFPIVNRMGLARYVWIYNTNDWLTSGWDSGRGDGSQQRPSTTAARWFSQASDARPRWAETSAGDPQERDLLAKIVVEQTLKQEAAVASLSPTTQAQTLAFLESAMRSRSPSSQIAAFARCLGDDRDAIVRVAAR